MVRFTKRKNKLNIFKSVDYLFAAPNYLKVYYRTKDIEGNKHKRNNNSSTGDNHINVSIPVISIKNDSILGKKYILPQKHNFIFMFRLYAQTNRRNIVRT